MHRFRGTEANLQRVEAFDVPQAGGLIQARCPACAEAGSDKSGEHLRLYADGRFGCCVRPKAKEHRKRIFALASIRQAGTFALRVKTPPPPVLEVGRSVKAALTTFNRRKFETGNFQSRASVREEAASSHACKDLKTPVSNSAALPLLAGGRALKVALTAFDASRPGMPETDFQNGVRSVLCPPGADLGTRRTGFSESRACAPEAATATHTCKDFEKGVRGVPSVGRLPYLTAGGVLVIPFAAPARYHWWCGGQSLVATLGEITFQTSEGRKE